MHTKKHFEEKSKLKKNKSLVLLYAGNTQGKTIDCQQKLEKIQRKALMCRWEGEENWQVKRTQVYKYFPSRIYSANAHTLNCGNSTCVDYRFTVFVQKVTRLQLRDQVDLENCALLLTNFKAEITVLRTNLLIWSWQPILSIKTFNHCLWFWDIKNIYEGQSVRNRKFLIWFLHFILET